MARAWLRAVDNGGPLPMEIAFREELEEARLDGSLESVERLDQLLLRIRSTRDWTAQAWDMLPGGEEFLRFVCFHVGRVLERLCAIDVNWCTREQAAPWMPADKPLPPERWARLVGVVGDSALLPMALVEDLLFHASPGMTCRQYIERWTERATGHAREQYQNTDENAACKELLAAMQAAGQSEGRDIAYRNEVRALRLDFSIDSLKRLDSLLRVIRKREQPAYEDFLGKPGTRDFIRWAAFYAGVSAARHARTSIKWLNHRELKSVAEELEFQFETTCGCILGDRLYLPLGLVTEILFHPQPQRTLSGWARAVDAQTETRLIPVPRRLQRASAAGTLNTRWDKAARAAGWLAAWAMSDVADGGTLAPLLLEPQADGQSMIRDFKFFEDGSEAQRVAAAQLEQNPDKLPFQVLAFDAFINLPTGRTDAVTLEARCYGGGLLSSNTVMMLKIACPYRPAGDPQGFAIHEPVLLETSAPAEMHGALFDRFHLGIDSFRSEQFSWDGCVQVLQ